MRFLVLFLLVIPHVAFAIPALAQEPPAVCNGKDLIAELTATDPTAYAAIEAEAAKLVNSDAKLWRIEKDRLTPSFVFGTIGSTDDRVLKLVERIDTLVLAAETVFANVADGDEETYTQVLMSLGDQVMFERGDNMLMRLESADYRKLREHMLKTGGSLDYIKGFKPWMFHDYVNSPLCEDSRVEAGLPTIQRAIVELAIGAGRPVADIETMEAELRNAAAQPFDLQLAELTFAIRGLDWLDDWRETGVRAYLDNRLAWYTAYSAWAAANDPSAMAVHRYRLEMRASAAQRLRDLALPALGKGNTFVATPVEYLPGDKGLVALFREAGYTVTPVE